MKGQCSHHSKTVRYICPTKFGIRSWDKCFFEVWEYNNFAHAFSLVWFLCIRHYGLFGCSLVQAAHQGIDANVYLEAWKAARPLQSSKIGCLGALCGPGSSSQSQSKQALDFGCLGPDALPGRSCLAQGPIKKCQLNEKELGQTRYRTSLKKFHI